MPRENRPRIALRDDTVAHDRRTWQIIADGDDVGIIAAQRVGDRAQLTCSVEPAHRRCGVAREAIGRVIGARPFGDQVVLTATVDASDLPSRKLLGATGFIVVQAATDGVERWERPVAARSRNGPERFLTRDGRVERFPVREVDLVEVLALVAPRVLAAGEVLTEPELNERLADITADVALLRRHLVDHGFVERTRSGSEYALVEPVDNF